MMPSHESLQIVEHRAKIYQLGGRDDITFFNIHSMMLNFILIFFMAE